MIKTYTTEWTANRDKRQSRLRNFRWLQLQEQRNSSEKCSRLKTKKDKQDFNQRQAKQCQPPTEIWEVRSFCPFRCILDKTNRRHPSHNNSKEVIRKRIASCQSWLTVLPRLQRTHLFKRRRDQFVATCFIRQTWFRCCCLDAEMKFLDS